MTTIADAIEYASNSWIKDPSNQQVTSAQEDIKFTFTEPATGIALREVHAPNGKQNIGRATNSQGNLIPNNGVYDDNVGGTIIKKRYVHRYFETYDKQFGTIYEGTHTIRTHKYRSVTANKHSYVSSRTVHINSEHTAAGANALVRDDDPQYTDVIGTPESETVDLDWNGTDWVLSANALAVLNDGNTGRYVIQDAAIHQIGSGGLTFSDAADTDPVETGITEAYATFLPNFGTNVVVVDQAANPSINFVDFIASLEIGSVAS